MSTLAASMRTLVSAKWLYTKLQSKKLDNLILLHVSFEGKQDYDQKHISGSLFFDGTHCVDKKSPYKNMLPDLEVFQSYMRELGVKNDSQVLLYDAASRPIVGASARVWFMFRVFGHSNVGLLNGGLADWVLQGYPTTAQESLPTNQSSYQATFRADLVKSYEQVVENMESKQFQLVDVRSSEQFRSAAESSTSRIRPGHILGAVNMPSQLLVDTDTKLIKDIVGLKEAFRAANVNLNAPFVSHCGTGMSACALLLAAHLLGKEDVACYDGSWFEYSRRSPPELIEEEK